MERTTDQHHVSVRMTNNMYQRLLDAACDMRITKSELIRKLVSEFIIKHEKQDQGD